MKHPAELRMHAIALARAFNIHLIDEVDEIPDLKEIDHEYVQYIAKRHGIPTIEMLKNVSSQGERRIYRHNRTGERRQFEIAYVRRIDNEFTYAIALHEIGHFAHPGGTCGIRDVGPGTLYDMECCAWEFAKHHALIWTPKMEAAKSIGLHSYERKLPRAA